MSKHAFTEEDQQFLRNNPYTYRVTPQTISFTMEFKEIFLREYKAGKIPRTILEENGYPTEILGQRRIWGISQSIRKEHERYGEFHEGVLSCNARKTTDDVPVDEQIKHLRHEVDYLKQEIEFLKKISSIRNTGK